MISTYEKRLTTFKKWSHIKSSAIDIIAIEFCHESNIKNFTTCSECDLKLSNWKFKRDFMKAHTRQSSNCSFVKNSDEKKAFIIDSTSTKSASINCIAFSPQILYLIIEDLYHKQQTLLAKIEKDLAVIEAEETAIVAQETAEQEVVAARKQRSKFKSNEFFKSFKFEESTISFSSTSTISDFESIIKSDAVLVASSIFTSVSKNSKMISSRSISFCSTSTILLINQSSYLLVANQFVAQISYQHIVMTLFFNYDKRLTIFKKWFHTSFTSKALIQAEFHHTSTKLSLNCTTCRRCDLILIDWKSRDDSIKEHLLKSSECSKAKEIVVASSISISVCMSISNIEKLEAEKVFIVAQKAMKQEIVVAVIETIKSEICVKNINFFDLTMQIDFWEKFRISVNSANFLYHLIEFAVKYKKKSILKILFRCFRDSALQWLKDQLKFISLNDFKLAMTKVFSFVELVVNLDSIIINSSSRYHICSKCSIQFSSISRLLIHAQKNCNKIYTCKHCEKTFTSNNEFHEHVRLHHIRKNYNNKTLKQRFVEERNSHINLSISRFTFSITFKSMIASTRSLFLVIFMTKTSVVCLFTSSSSSFRISILSHITSKIYMIMKKLFEMFVEKADKKNRKIIQKKSTFSCFSESRQSRQTRIKSIDRQESMKDSIMLAKKQFIKSLNAIRKRMRFSLSSMFDQIQIINYFKFADQSNSTSIKSIKFSTFINCFNSTSRVCFSINQDAKTSHIAFETNFTSLIKSRIKTRASIDSSESKYLVAADVDHINKDIRVETSLTNARKYNSIKSLKSFKKLKFSIFSSRFNSTSRVCSSFNQDARTSHIDFTSCRSFKSIKFSTFINCLNSTSRVCFSVNQVAEIQQYQHIAIDKVKLFKSLKSAAIISSLNSTFRFSLSVNHDSLNSIPSRIDFLRALINQQMIYASILASSSFRTRVHRCRRRSHRDLDIRVETTLKEREE